MAKHINRRIAAEISWSRTADRSARTCPAREQFLKRFEKDVDPDGKLPAEERRRRADHALRAYMLRLRKRNVPERRRLELARSTRRPHTSNLWGLRLRTYDPLYAPARTTTSQSRP